ncbi:MAG: indolepyruvate oxidoreductase subunit beta [Synergistaceae bacterium]|nr:indolepyruvate oxidoreductase subunit beta [Synergistaceae bacterium]MBP9626211.1 indolepyruvate oxidoreductase subunit beta [Synergistaceae bacterium]
MTKSILLVGVGGQGTILASKLLTIGLMQAGYDVKMSEIHGMSQRGGSVSSQVRFGKDVQSPVIELGGADILVSFEKMEALRWLEYLRPNGVVVVNDYQISPMPVVSGIAEYADTIIDELNAKVKTTLINAFDEAVALGNPRVMNIILLGVTIEMMNLDDINWDEILKSQVKADFYEINKKALAKGREIARAA